MVRDSSGATSSHGGRARQTGASAAGPAGGAHQLTPAEAPAPGGGPQERLHPGGGCEAAATIRGKPAGCKGSAAGSAGGAGCRCSTVWQQGTTPSDTNACIGVVCCSLQGLFPYILDQIILALLVVQVAGQLKRVVSLLRTGQTAGEGGGGHRDGKQKETVMKAGPKQAGAKKRAQALDEGNAKEPKKARKRVAAD